MWKMQTLPIQPNNMGFENLYASFYKNIFIVYISISAQEI